MLTLIKIRKYVIIFIYNKTFLSIVATIDRRQRKIYADYYKRPEKRLQKNTSKKYLILWKLSMFFEIIGNGNMFIQKTTIHYDFNYMKKLMWIQSFFHKNYTQITIPIKASLKRLKECGDIIVLNTCWMYIQINVYFI